MPVIKTNPSGVTRGKLALICVLGLVLVYVLASNFGSTPDALMASEARKSSVSAAVPSGHRGDGAKTNNPFGEYAEDAHWPLPPVAKITYYDPFASTIQDSAGPQYNAEEINELRNAQNAIIFVSEGQTVARIGTQELRVGDMVGGLVIQEISRGGIVLSEPE